MKITCFGEILWDVFPTHKKIGGAPLNVALRLQSMGIDVAMISSIGSDTLGKEIIDHCKKQGLSEKYIQIDQKYPTGEVIVTLDPEGVASYKINSPVAWDFIETSEVALQTVIESDAFIFGSLASRNEVSQNTLFRFLEKATYKILDINLRPPHYNDDLLIKLMQQSDFIKFNDEELEKVCNELNIKDTDIKSQIRQIATASDTDQICVTKGKNGAMLFYNNHFYHNDGYQVQVVDTVGAGDSFLATLISNLINKKPPQVSLDHACAIGAMVAGREGANPFFTTDEINIFMAGQQV